MAYIEEKLLKMIWGHALHCDEFFSFFCTVTQGLGFGGPTVMLLSNTTVLQGVLCHY